MTGSKTSSSNIVRPVLRSLLILLICSPLARAQSLSLSATLELSQIYRVDAWQPVRIELRNESDRIVDGTIVLPLNHETARAAIQLPMSV